jgi:eukaryotic-like serine/threonine-protein kinase
MNAVEHHPSAAPPAAALVPGTLRASLEQRGRSRRLSLEVAIAQFMPLCVEVAEMHAEGYGLYLHPSNVFETAAGTLSFARELATALPVHPRDHACLPPETQQDQLNDARANVYALAAILYELVTGEVVAQGMRRPTEVVPTLPIAFENILSRALILDRAHRPHDINAFAQAIHELLPRGSIAPPPRSDPAPFTTGSIPIDVSFSYLPPAPTTMAVNPVAVNPYGVLQPVVVNGRDGTGKGGTAPHPPVAANGYAQAPQPAAPVNGYGVVAVAPPASEPKPPSDKSPQIAELRAQLEADPRARYFVFKEGMDHGPFTALELVQHIDSHAFLDDNQITDSIERHQALIRDWPPFSLFAENAKRQRELVARQHAIGKIAAQETKTSRGKAILGVVLLLAMIGGAGGWYQIQRGSRDDDVEIKSDDASNVETDSAIGTKKKKPKKSKAGGGGFSVAGGQSCEGAIDSYNEEKVMGQQGGQADLTAGQYGRVLNSGSYFGHCGVPNNMGVSICAAVQNGRAVGVTVSTTPADRQKIACITSAVRNLSFPSHPKMDVTRTRFDAQ